MSRMHLAREDQHQDHRHKGQIRTQRDKMNGKEKGGVKKAEGGLEDVNGKRQAKVLMCCLLPVATGSWRCRAFLASGTYWFDHDFDSFSGLQADFLESTLYIYSFYHLLSSDSISSLFLRCPPSCVS